ncbi:protein FAM169B isoform X1 [Gymnodraco acuticeps]|uniref:Protein FAM169B isoform X1 n=2 Tax=Gymnodraco acuticeps TaxID=8218 RepID=A0A6P8SM96_GYMAC|nr:protein FAM169B isoform X1 [Gymnodraco acuticeps]XP_034051646.1 protein FAM169B isoform X1 [Gymnodraco acuticeps]XP_034051648.1 protein FAM169B isoform X1 [Gymnodraco acuticeps]
MYPVDLPAVEDTDLTSVSELYLSSLESGTHNEEWFELSHTSKVAITANNVRLLQLFDDHQSDCTLLALHPPNDPTQVLALYLQDQWWSVDDALRTCCKDRNGLISVQSLMERVIVFLLSQVLERSPQEKTLFSLHPRTESCKLLWRDSQAVGFYTIKHKGSLCDGWSSRCYLLPTLDTLLVRRGWRRRGLGLLMLEDFCSSFSTEEILGVSAPLSPSMVAVCRSFLQQHEEHLESLYEVEAPGGWTQRRNIWLSIQLGRYTSCIKEESGPASGDTQRNNDSSLKSSDCRPDPESCSDVDAPLVTGSSAQQLELCAQRRAGRSPSSCVSGTGCCPAAHAEDLDSGPPCRPPQSLNTQQALKPKPSVSAEPGEVEEEQRNAKRVRRT